MPAQLVEGVAQGGFVRNAANNEMGVGVFRRKEQPGRFSDGMTGLDDLLSRGEILADQDVKIRNLGHLESS